MDCKNCGKVIPPNKRFCNSSCAASFNNKNRKIDNSTKQKIASSLKKDLPKDDIIKDYNEGFNSVRLGEKYGVHSTTIASLLKKEGVWKGAKTNKGRFCTEHNQEYVKNVNGKYRCSKCCQERVSERRRELKRKAVEYKGGKCECCSYDKCIAALEFHHLDPNQKDFGIGNGNTKGWESIKTELDKCIMVCANCHREIHDKERKE